MRHTGYLLLLCFLLGSPLWAQTISGTVTDAADGKPLADVAIQNIFTLVGSNTDSTGRFSAVVTRGQLIEFRKLGYRTARMRIPSGALPPFFKIVMEKGALELDEVEVHDRYRSYHSDSIRNYEEFKSEIEFPKMTGLDMINHPFSALSKRNRQIWAFQKEYAWFEEQKYVDYAFNEKLVTNLTGLTGDSVQLYLRAYRPSYGQLRSMGAYDFFSYVKQTVAIWRKRQSLGPAGSRGGN